MNILILHNNNIPVDLRQSFKLENNDYNIKIIKYSSEEQYDFDTSICNNLNVIFHEQQYDVIIIPYTLGEENYIGYSGLRIATHIRLTEKWGHYMTPIIFLGIDNIMHIMKLSNYGGILSTYRIYTSEARTREELADKIKTIDCKKSNTPYKEWLTDPKFQHFLNRINVKAPTNYATHHSIANKWSVIRWIEMFSWVKDAPKFEDENFRNMLYFKYLLALAGNRELFTNKKKKNNPIIPKIDDVYKSNDYDGNGNIIKKKRIIYIDDEEKMWQIILKPIFDNSEIDFISYPFAQHNRIDKDSLIKNIKSFLKDDYNKNGGADCYLIDLRLHDGDFVDKIKSELLSGHQIAKYIKSLNNGCQIVIFTASNKSWNIEESMVKIGACGYVTKETPEMNYSRNESYQLFCEFERKIKGAFKLSHLKQLYKDLDNYKGKNFDITPLYDYADLLNFDKGQNNDIIIKSCIISQMRFIEAIIKKNNFFIEGDGGVTKNGERIGSIFQKIVFSEDADDVRISNEIIKIDALPDDKGWKYAKGDADISKIVAALWLYYKISENNIKSTIKMRYERNTSAAHWTEEKNKTTITLSELQNHFKNVIIPILNKEIELL